jgi:hypothetical protein
MNIEILEKANKVIKEISNDQIIKSVTMNSVTDAWLEKGGYLYVEITITFNNDTGYFTAVTTVPDLKLLPSYYFAITPEGRKLADSISEAESIAITSRGRKLANILNEA